MTHLSEHSYAFVKNGIVENICIFAEHDDDLSNLLAIDSGADEAIDCCINGIAYIGGTWDGNRFKPVEPEGNLGFDEESWTWILPTADEPTV